MIKTKVTISDDSFRLNLSTFITPAMRLKAFQEGRPLPQNVIYLLAKDNFGNQAQDKITNQYVYEGRMLELAILRAKRWIRSKNFGFEKSNMPRHIAKAMAAFHKADPVGFKETVSAAVA